MYRYMYMMNACLLACAPVCLCMHYVQLSPRSLGVTRPSGAAGN